jgi:hypothetical protein
MRTRGNRNADWIEEYCVCPSGPRKGRHARLTPREEELVRRIYDAPDGAISEEVSGDLASYLCLLHLCGIEAPKASESPALDLHTDPWSVWAAAGPDVLEVIKREGEAVTCPALGTRWPRAA